MDTHISIIIYYAEKIFHNPIFFPHQQVKCISGAIPDGIQGRFFRNGPATLSYDKKNILTHWFGGVGGLLKL
jgi:carotenoid cleavage dioxygenase-like enzyme